MYVVDALLKAFCCLSQFIKLIEEVEKKGKVNLSIKAEIRLKLSAGLAKKIQLSVKKKDWYFGCCKPGRRN